MYLLFVTSPNPATPSHLSLFALSLFPFSSLFALVCVCTYVYVCECVSWLCECEFHCFLLYLCNFRVVVFLRQLFGAPFFKTNHKHHEADDDNLYFASSSFSLRVHCNQVRVFFFCFSSIVFVHKFTRRSKITVAFPSVAANCQIDSRRCHLARGVSGPPTARKIVEKSFSNGDKMKI